MLPKDFQEQVREFAKEWGISEEETAKILEESYEYGAMHLDILEGLRHKSPLSHGTIISKFKDQHLAIKLIYDRYCWPEDRKILLDGLVPWEKLKEKYDKILEKMEKDSLIEAEEYGDRKLYWITQKGKKEYDGFVKRLRDSLKKSAREGV